MKETVAGIVGALVTLIALGLVLRYGGTSVPLAETASKTLSNTIDALTLANPSTYPYYGPAGYNG